MNTLLRSRQIRMTDQPFSSSAPAQTRSRPWVAFWLILIGLVITQTPLTAADFTVGAGGFPTSYRINSVSGNPTLTLIRGETYTFAVNSGSIHPFFIKSLGASNNNISLGTITYTVPMTVSNYAYECSIHRFTGTIVTIPPPVFRLVDLNVSDNLILKSTGASNWVLSPQFSTNLGSTNWFALTVQSNRFLNGTNETFCGRPPGTNVFIRLKADRN